MKSSRIFTVLFAGLAMMLANGQRALAVDIDIFNSIAGETSPYSGANFVLNSGDLFAQQIQTTSANTIINSLSLALGSQVPGSAGSYNISFYTSVADAPGVLISGSTLSGNVALLPDSTNINALATFTGLNINLPTATKYFVVLNNFSGSGFSLNWAQTTTVANPYPNLIWGLDVGSSGFVNGTQNVGTNPFLLRVTTAAVPEPSTWAMMVVAAGTLAGVGYRRRTVRA